MKKLISIDAETNGLWGKPFAIAVKFGDEERVWRCPVEGDVDPWVEENVLTQIESVEETHETLDAMLKDFASWWLEHKEGTEALWHMGHVVEAGLFRLLLEGGYIGPWDAPYTPIEVSEALRLAGEDQSSVDAYMEKYGIKKPELEGGSHHPLYDAIVALEVYKHLQQRNENNEWGL